MQRVLICLALLVAPWSLAAAQAQEFQTTRLGDRALVWTRLYPDSGGRSNCTVLASSDGLIVVDPPA